MSSSDLSMQEVTLEELNMSMVAMQMEFSEYMQRMCESQMKMVEHLEKIGQPR